MISIIVATASNNVIGKDNDLPWNLPADMKFFKETTTGHIVITGRKNYESIPEKYRPLANRTNIILTRQKRYTAPGAIIVDTVADALHFARKRSLDNATPETGPSKIFIIGGAEIYKEFLPYAERVYLTKIKQDIEGDTFFPSLNPEEWFVSSSKAGIVDDKNIYEHDYLILDRR